MVMVDLGGSYNLQRLAYYDLYRANNAFTLLLDKCHVQCPTMSVDTPGFKGTEKQGVMYRTSWWLTQVRAAHSVPKVRRVRQTPNASPRPLS